MESRTESAPVKRKYEDHLITDAKRSKSDDSASLALASINDVKPRVSAATQNLKGKSLLVHDHGEANKSVHPSQFVCGVCFAYKPVSDMFKAGKCNHPFCTNCICKHVSTQIQQSIHKVICPNTNCSVELEPQYFWHTILPNEVINRWELGKCESLIGGEEKTYCPFEDCGVLLVNDDGGVVTSAECPCCHRLFCAQCKVPWHATMSCEEFQGSKDEQNLDSAALLDDFGYIS